MSILDFKKYKLYLPVAQQLVKLPITWSELAFIDAKLTKKWVNFGEIEAHNVCLTLDYMPDYLKDFEAFLDSEYGKSLKLIRYSCVDYLKDVSFSQLGVFAKCDINSKLEIPGLIGYLVDIKEDEISPSFNDFSVIESSRVGVQWLMLGPISFVNASCRPNVAYVNVKNLMVCVPLREIKAGEELTISYQNHFFAPNNEFCLCPYKSLHGNPFPELAVKRRKVTKKNKGIDLAPNPLNRFSRQGFPSRLRMFFPENRICENLNLITYESFFALSDDSRDLERSTLTPVEETFQNLTESDDASTDDIDSPSSPNQNQVEAFRCSSPVNLQNFEEGNFCDKIDENLPAPISLDFNLYEGANVTHDEFIQKFSSLSNKHKLSDVVKSDFLKFFASVLPYPNKIFADIPATNLPLVTSTSFGSSKLLMIDLIPQLNRIVKKNISYIQQSWSNLCNWETPTDAFCKSELQLVFNTDGAPIFKSSKLSVWPTWVQIFNLPPVLRSSYSNICLLALWYGESKPDFDDMLQRVCLELESFSNGVLFESIGRVFLRYRSIVCDAPARAYVLCMKQHMGYDSCAHCFIKVFIKIIDCFSKCLSPSFFEKKTSFKLVASLLTKDELLSTV